MAGGTELELQSRLRASLAAATKERDRVAQSALRSALSAIDNATAVTARETTRSVGKIAGAVIGLGTGDVPRRELTADEISEIVRREIAERQLAADEYTQFGQTDAAARLRAEAEVLTAHLEQGGA